MYVKPGVMDRSQLRLAGKRTRWPETETLDRETISLIWKTPSMTDPCKTGRNGSFATSFGRKTDPMTGNRNNWPGNDFAYLENAVDD